MCSYPDHFIRGLSDPKSLTPDNTLTVTAFQFDSNEKRTDYDEASINWCLNNIDDVQNFTLSQVKKDGETIQFKVGVAIIPRRILDKTRKLHASVFTFEKQPITEEPINEYHGNLLLKKNTEKMIRSTIQGILCSDEDTKIVLQNVDL